MFLFFSVQIFDSTNSKTRPIYETLIKKMVDTLRLSTLHKSMKRKINQVYFTVQPSDSVSHLALFEFLDFVTKPFMLGFFSFTIFNRAWIFSLFCVYNIWCDSHSNIKLWWLTQCEDNIIAMTFVQQWMKLSQQQSSSINYSFFDTAV